ncbi:MAG TPA: ferritin-like domain-containing protein [Acidimicrobiales bacterium]|nr:ferritin-like domain-containing protein [Acidimicrobiales bacterium]
MNTDPSALASLLEESQDLQADALRPTSEALEELIEQHRESSDEDPTTRATFHDEHRNALAASLRNAPLLSAAGGLALIGALASPAAAATSKDVQILQTAASIENLAVATYKAALSLPYIGGSSANGVITAFARTTMSQHAQHTAAFNAAIRRLKGRVQTKPDPAFVPVVNKAVGSLSGMSDAAATLAVVGLALELENIAAETYVKNTSLVDATSNRGLFASIMGVEAQHVSVLLAVQALLSAGAPQLIALSPTTVSSLPAIAGKVGFPNPFYKTNQAAPASQGAVK